MVFEKFENVFFHMAIFGMKLIIRIICDFYK
jgi:hypothetical protein